MGKYKLIIIDALILLSVCSGLVVGCNQAVKGIKKDARLDPLVVSITQDDLGGLQEGLKKEEPGMDLRTKVNKADEHGRTPLMWAAYASFSDKKALAETDGKRVPMIDALVKSGADLELKDKDGWSALMWAAWSGMPQVTQVLLGLGANVTDVDRQGNSALMLAASRGNAAVVKLLLDKGADKMRAGPGGRKAVDFAQEGLKNIPSKQESFEAVLKLL